MTTETPVSPPDDGNVRNDTEPADTQAADTTDRPPTGTSTHVALATSPEFEALRRALRRFVFPMTAAFLIWYGLYVLLSAYARDFMSHKVAGNINVALVFGLLQFVSTFLIAWAYARYADRTLDPLAERVRRHADDMNDNGREVSA